MGGLKTKPHSRKCLRLWCVLTAIKSLLLLVNDRAYSGLRGVIEIQFSSVLCKSGWPERQVGRWVRTQTVHRQTCHVTRRLCLQGRGRWSCAVFSSHAFFLRLCMFVPERLLEKPHSRLHQPVCGCCYLFTVCNSGLLFIHVAGIGFPIPLSADKKIFPVILNCYLRPSLPRHGRQQPQCKHIYSVSRRGAFDGKFSRKHVNTQRRTDCFTLTTTWSMND